MSVAPPTRDDLVLDHVRGSRAGADQQRTDHGRQDEHRAPGADDGGQPHVKTPRIGYLLFFGRFTRSSVERGGPAGG